LKTIADKEGTTDSVTLPKAGLLVIGEPLVNMSFAAVAEELKQFYGDRYQIIDMPREMLEPGEASPPKRKK
jgi:hypothetical protein